VARGASELGRTDVRRRTLIRATALGCLLASLAAGEAAASITVTRDARSAALRVDAGGYAEVTWTSAGGGQGSLLIAPDGALRYGGRLTGADVSTGAGAPSIPFAIVIRRTPDGTLWALQAWRRLVSGSVELRFSRWRGDPTRLTLRAVCCKWGGENIEGRASFHGRPIYGRRSTPAGVPLDLYGRNVYLDSLRGGGWMRMMGILTNRPTGYYSLWIRSYWQGSRYRGAIIGPNWGWTLAPDAAAEAPSSRGIG
jgi:hypothetical protein